MCYNIATVPQMRTKKRGVDRLLAFLICRCVGVYTCSNLPALLPQGKSRASLRVQATGFDSRANCALGLPRSRTSTGSSLCTDSPSNPTILVKQKGRTSKARPLCLVQVTGFEPTRISSLEPDGNSTSVERAI